MTINAAARFQFASDFDGDLYLFPSNLDEPNYQQRWQAIVFLADGSRREAPLDTPPMCVNDGVVSNPLGESGHRQVAGWNVDFTDSSEIEISIDEGPAIRIKHPRP